MSGTLIIGADSQFGPLVEVAPNLRLDGPAMVGLIAIPQRGRGWVELWPEEARRIGEALLKAADESEVGG